MDDEKEIRALAFSESDDDDIILENGAVEDEVKEENDTYSNPHNDSSYFRSRRNRAKSECSSYIVRN